MNFLLYNTIFDNIFSIFLIINGLITSLLTFNEIKDNEDSENKKDEKIDNKNIYLFKIITISIWFIIFIIIMIYFTFKYDFISYFTLLYYFVFVWLTFKMRKKNISDLSYENKMTYIQTTILYAIFFSSKASFLYFETFTNVPHIVKEYMLIVFLVIKLLFFIFCLIINFSIFISNITVVLNKTFNLIKFNIEKYINKEFELGYYNFHFSNNGKNKKMLFIDILIFVILCPITIIFNLIVPLLIILSKFLLKKLLIIGSITTHYLDNSSIIISKTIKVSAIFSLIIVYVIIVYNPDIIFSETKDIYTLITTVILIPLVYDNIKK